VRNDKRPGVTRSGRCFQRLFNDEPKLLGIIGVEAAGTAGGRVAAADTADTARTVVTRKALTLPVINPAAGDCKLSVLALVGVFHRFELKIHGPLGVLLRLTVVAFVPGEPGQSQIDLGLLAIPPTCPPQVLARPVEVAA